MEINKEREDFEAEFSKIKSDIAFWLHTWDEEMQGYNHPVMCWFWHMWQAAKTQAVPEGFVLVEKKILLEGVNKIEQLFEDDPLLALGELLPIQQGLKAMIEAQDPTND